MSAEVQRQFYFLFLSFLWGMWTCWVYDGFRVFRNLIHHSKRFVNLEDLLYWLFMTVALFYLLFTYHRGKIRSYIIIGLMTGHLFYYKTISPVYVAFLCMLLKPVKILVLSIRRLLRKINTKSRDKHCNILGKQVK